MRPSHGEQCCPRLADGGRNKAVVSGEGLHRVMDQRQVVVGANTGPTYGSDVDPSWFQRDLASPTRTMSARPGRDGE
jgi:hypothetical protein